MGKDERKSWPVRTVQLVGLLLFVLFTGSEARPPQILEFGNSDNTVIWTRLQNRELRVDFSPVDPHRPESVILRDDDLELVPPGPAFSGLWVDSLNGEVVVGGTSTQVVPSTLREEAILRTRTETFNGLVLEKSVRVLPEGANLEVGYRVLNPSSETVPFSYSLRSAWRPGPEGVQTWYHLPRRTEITRFDSETTSVPVIVDGPEFDENWFCVDSPATGLSIFLVSRTPFEKWTASPPVDGVRAVETVLAAGSLKPGEWIEGTYWVGIVRDIGIPISAGPKYIAGLVWREDGSTGSYCLESRVVGMPNSLKKFRMFSAVGEVGSVFKAVPKYIRRSRLSNTEAISLPLPTFSRRSGSVEVEQSLYSSSENVGYWKVALRTPEDLIAASTFLSAYDVNHIPGLERAQRVEKSQAPPARVAVTAEPVGFQLHRIKDEIEKERLDLPVPPPDRREVEEILPGGGEPIDPWEGPGFVKDRSASTPTREEEAALLAIEDY